MSFLTKKISLVNAEEALSGRDTAMPLSGKHYVNGNSIQPPFQSPIETALFGMGCFWGVEKLFWQLSGVYSTAVGYSAGHTPNPSYQEVCSGQTAHNEVILVAFNPSEISYETLLMHFWEGHNPTQGMQQGNDRGTQYRSGIYTTSEAQQQAAGITKQTYQEALTAAGHGEITTEILPADTFYYAEEYHQQYLAKNPAGYCGLGGTQVKIFS